MMKKRDLKRNALESVHVNVHVTSATEARQEVVIEKAKIVIEEVKIVKNEEVEKEVGIAREVIVKKAIVREVIVREAIVREAIVKEVIVTGANAKREIVKGEMMEAAIEKKVATVIRNEEVTEAKAAIGIQSVEIDVEVKVGKKIVIVVAVEIGNVIEEVERAAEIETNESLQKRGMMKTEGTVKLLQQQTLMAIPLMVVMLVKKPMVYLCYIKKKSLMFGKMI